MGGILIDEAAAGWRRRNRLELSGMIFDGHDRRLAPSLQTPSYPGGDYRPRGMALVA